MVWTVPLAFSALSVVLTDPVMLPAAAGVKLMGSVQEVAAAREAVLPELVVNAGQAVLPVLLTLKLLETLGFVPVPGMGKVKGAFPMLENVTVWGLSLLVEPTLVEAKFRVGPVPSATL